MRLVTVDLKSWCSPRETRRLWEEPANIFRVFCRAIEFVVCSYHCFMALDVLMSANNCKLDIEVLTLRTFFELPPK